MTAVLAGASLHEAFAAQAARTPDAPAVYAADGVLTYAELDARSADLARRLVAEGAGPGVGIGVCVERTPELLVALYGVLRSGACYVPLDPGYPAERLRYMTGDSRTGLVVTSAASRGRCPQGPALLDVAGGFPTTAGPGPVAGVPEDAAYVIYTSGSTGRPKGVPIRHASCAAMLAAMDVIFDGCDLGGVVAASSVCFDMSVLEIFHPLGRGGAVVLVDSAVHLAETPHLGKVTQLNAIPSVMTTLLDAGGLPPGLHTVVLGGETVRRRLVDRVYAETGADRVYNGYGPTEGTVFCTFGVVPPDATGEPTIGRPTPGARVHVLDDDLRPVPPGRPGELWLGGAGLTPGYLNDPDATAARFRPDPEHPGERMYRTGDVARFTDDGEVEFLGRADHQVKVRGFRIELEEVEAHLAGCPGVREAAAAALPGPDGGPARLVGYVVPDAPADAADGPRLDPGTQSRITERLAERVPDHMIPETVVVLAALPLAPNDKLDRAALPEPPAPAGPSTTTVAAQSPTEQALVEIWAELLERAPDTVGTADTFYELGGNSLLLVRLARMMSRRFGRRVAIADLFRFRDIAALAGWLDDEGEDTPDAVRQARRRATARRTTVRRRATG